MAEYTLADLISEVRPDVAGINELAVTRAARLAARYFCSETAFLQIETAPLLDIVADQATYAITPDADGRPIVRALEVWVGDEQVFHKTKDQYDREQNAPREHLPWTVGHGNLTYSSLYTPWRTLKEYPPKWFYQELPHTIRLVGIPDQSVAATLRIVSCVQPPLGATTVDEIIINNWYETIVHGTKAFLFMAPQQSWSNVQLGRTMLAEFETMTAEALAESVAGFAANDHAVGHVRAHP